VDWNNEEQRVMIPTRMSTTIVNSLYQVYRGIIDLLPRPDVEYIFEALMMTMNDQVFGKIKSDLMITKEVGYKLLCDELDYLIENTSELFGDKLGLNVIHLQNTVKEIEALKTVFLSS
jgi:hypothetical protein